MSALDTLTAADSTANARFLAARQLGDAGNPVAVDALIRVAESDPDDMVREEAIYALTQIGDPRATPTFQHIFVTADHATYGYKLAIAAYGGLELLGGAIPVVPSSDA